MYGFLYWIPNRESISVSELMASDLAYAFTIDGEITTVPGVGPTGTRGVFVAMHVAVPAPKVCYRQDEQEWRAIPTSSIEAWCGLYQDDKPGPEVLARHEQLAGHQVKLSDGQEWLVPVARKLVEQDDKLLYTCALPTAWDIDDNGEWVERGVVARYRDLWAIAEAFWTQRSAVINAKLAASQAEKDGDPPPERPKITFEFSRQLDAAVLALRENYRVSRLEVAMLGLLDEVSTTRILEAVTDVPVWQEWCKKKVASLA